MSIFLASVIRTWYIRIMKTMLLLALMAGMLFGFAKFMAHSSAPGTTSLAITDTRINNALR